MLQTIASTIPVAIGPNAANSFLYCLHLGFGVVFPLPALLWSTCSPTAVVFSCVSVADVATARPDNRLISPSPLARCLAPTRRRRDLPHRLLLQYRRRQRRAARLPLLHVRQPDLLHYHCSNYPIAAVPNAANSFATTSCAVRTQRSSHFQSSLPGQSAPSVKFGSDS
jgi:hypothetical protein